MIPFRLRILINSHRGGGRALGARRTQGRRGRLLGDAVKRDGAGRYARLAVWTPKLVAVIVLIVTVLATSFAPMAQQEPPRSERWAVVIGAGHERRQYAIADAEAMYQILVGPMGFSKDHVVLLTDRSDRKPTLRNIRWALGTFLIRAAKKGDTVVIFWAGHGGVEADPRGGERDGLSKYFVVADTDPRDLFSTAVAMDEVQTVFARIEAERVVAFFDASYSGAAGGRTFSTKKPGRGGEGGVLEALARSHGRMIIASSRPNEIALETSDHGHGIFTYYLVEALKGAADENRDGVVTLQELYEYVQQQVTRKSRAMGGNQHPVMKGDLEGALPLSKIRP